MIKAIKIEILWSECPYLGNAPYVFEGDNCWEKARKLLRDAASLIKPDMLGYHKTDYKVTWADGETYEARADLKYIGHKDNEIDLPELIRQSCIFGGGLAMSPEHRNTWHWMKEDRYDAILANVTPEQQAACRTFLEEYEIGQPPAA